MFKSNWKRPRPSLKEQIVSARKRLVSVMGQYPGFDAVLAEFDTVAAGGTPDDLSLLLKQADDMIVAAEKAIRHGAKPENLAQCWA